MLEEADDDGALILLTINITMDILQYPEAKDTCSRIYNCKN